MKTLFLPIVLLIISYNSNRITLNHDFELTNTVWESEGVNCNSYYKFGTDEYMKLNPCYSNDQKGTIELLAWAQGNFHFSGDEMILNCTQACDKSLVSKSENLKFVFRGENQLFFVNNSDTMKLLKVASIPDIPSTAKTGYWDFVNGGNWVNTSGCRPKL